jgi:hypothetical protein
MTPPPSYRHGGTEHTPYLGPRNSGVAIADYMADLSRPASTLVTEPYLFERALDLPGDGVRQGSLAFSVTMANCSSIAL